jgi:hypothetical protein
VIEPPQPLGRSARALSAAWMLLVALVFLLTARLPGPPLRGALTRVLERLAP